MDKRTFPRPALAGALFGAAVAAGLASTPAAAATEPRTFANFEGAQVNPIRLSPDGTRLFAVNTPAGTLSVFDVSQPASPALIAEIPVGVEPVSVAARSNDEVWVVNQVSDSVSVVSVPRGIVIDTLTARDEPADVVFALGQAYVSVSRSNRIDVFDAETRQRVASLPVFGGSPRALAVSPRGNLVYAAFALSGNGTTIIPPDEAPAQPAPANPELPPPPQVGLIVRADDPLWSPLLRFTMPDNDVVAINAGPAPSIARYFSGVGTVNFALAVNPLLGDLWVANTEALNTVRFEPQLRGHFVDNRVTRIDAATGAVTAFDLNPGIDYAVLPNPAARATALAQPTAIAFDPSGLWMYVAAFGTDRVAVVDLAGSVRTRIEVARWSGAGPRVDPRRKRGPRGLALNAPAQTLYVLNRISNTIAIVDTRLLRVVAEVPVGYDPTPPEIKAGRGFLYDAKLSGNGTGSCASCHIDGDMDHLAWDLGDPGGAMESTTQDGRVIEFHPMKGPMTTQTLRGLSGLEPLHWRGDRADLAAFNPAFDLLMGGEPIAEEDMQAFSAFVDSLLFQPNPFQNLDRSFPARLLGGDPTAGFNHFVTLPLAIQSPGATPRTCNSCHEAFPGPGSNRTIDADDFTQPLKVPHLRNVYQKLLYNPLGPESIGGFGLDHDGRVGGLFAFFQGRAFALYSDQEALDLAAFLRVFDTGTAPAVGHAVTVTPQNAATPAVEETVVTLLSQAHAGNIDLIARGTLNGEVRGLLYQPSTGLLVADDAALGPYTILELEAFVEAGDTLTLMGVYPGTGTASRR